MVKERDVDIIGDKQVATERASTAGVGNLRPARYFPTSARDFALLLRLCFCALLATKV